MFIHEAILEDILCGDTCIDAADFHNKIEKIIKCTPQTCLSDFEKQFMVKTWLYRNVPCIIV